MMINFDFKLIDAIFSIIKPWAIGNRCFKCSLFSLEKVVNQGGWVKKNKLAIDRV